ncbi:hypothetical protein D9M71_256490 [compost metagenome]
MSAINFLGLSFRQCCRVLGCFFLVTGYSMAGDGCFSEAAAVGSGVYKYFIAEGLCRDFQDCIKKEYLFGECGGAIYLNFYGINDKRLIGEIENIIEEEFSELSEKAPMILSFYYGAHRDYVGLKGFFKRPDLIFEIE